MSWARLAAFIDGKGSILISRVRPSGGYANPQHALIVNVGNSDTRLILWLKNTFGGFAVATRSKFTKKAALVEEAILSLDCVIHGKLHIC